MTSWVDACGIDDVDDEDVIPFHHADQAFAIFKTDEGDISASDGYCTHERQLLCDGLVMGKVIECPKHNGRFDIQSGKALSAPVLNDLKMYPTKTENERVFIDVDG